MPAESSLEEPVRARADDVLGHDTVLEGLWRAARGGRLPHALLFHGPRGIGKFAAARLFAQGLFCARGVPEQGARPCGECGPCKRFVSGNHPDLFVVDVQAEEEPQELIHISRFVPRDDPKYDGPNVQEFLQLRALEGGRRVVLVREMERAKVQIEAQNSILKMLEEPGSGVVWVLETSRVDALLPTIRSRCVSVRFEPLERADVAAVLRRLAAGRSTPEPAQALAGELRAVVRWSRGSPGQAWRLLERSAARQRQLVVAALRGDLDALEASESVWAVDGVFAGKSPTAMARERARFVVGLALAVLRDAERARVGVDPATLAHGDLLEPRPAWIGSEALSRWRVEALLSISGDVELNLDPRGALDRTMLALANRAPGRLPGSSTNSGTLGALP